MNKHRLADGVDPTDDTTMTKAERNSMSKQPTGPVKGSGEDVKWDDKAIGAPSVYRMDMLPQRALLAIAELRGRAIAKYGEDGIDDWRGTRSQLHINKGLVHDSAFLLGDTSERNGDPLEHLIHSACRHLFALEIEIARREYDEPATIQATVSVDDQVTPVLNELQRMIDELALRMSIDLAIGNKNNGRNMTQNTIKDYLHKVFAQVLASESSVDPNATTGAEVTGDPVEDIATAVFNSFNINYHKDGPTVTRRDMMYVIQEAIKKGQA